MENSNGYIKLHRSILDWEWWDDINTRCLFTYLLLAANWSEKEWHGTTIRRGVVVTTLHKMSEKVGISIRSIRTSLKRLKSTGEVTYETSHKGYVITIENYDKYQLQTYPSDTPNDTPNGKQVTDQRHANDRNTNNDKNNKKDNYSFIPPDPPILKPDDEEFRRIVEEGKERLRRKEWM